MSNFREKILSAFVDIEESENEESRKENPPGMQKKSTFLNWENAKSSMLS